MPARPEYEALLPINDPVSGARAYNPGDLVYAEVVKNYDLVVGEDVKPSGVKVMAKPARNASRADWAAYALDQGVPAEDLEGLGRDGIAALFDEEPPGEPGDG